MIITLALAKSKHTIYLFRKKDLKNLPYLNKEEKAFIQFRLNDDINIVPLFNDDTFKILIIQPEDTDKNRRLENFRLLGNKACATINDVKIDSISISSDSANEEEQLAFCEGLILSNYQFNKYKTKKKKFKINSLKKVHLDKNTVARKSVTEINAVLSSVYLTRDLVNEPLSYLTAKQYSKDIVAAGKKFGFSTTVWHQKKIEQMKMGGVLAVNKGSVQPATFNILEHKPANPINKQPIVFVGKGVVYDTGGLSLKPTANSMDFMKCDMGGSAVVVGAMCAIAKNKLNVHVIGLIPAVENRPGGDAFAPGDVITMYDGTTVEVMNTDAEGRLIMADALAYAKKYKPSLVFDFATLTGAAARAIGPHGIATMGTCDDKTKSKIKISSEKTFERIVEFPLWDEFGEMLDSPIADIKNLGGGSAGAITAGKFLQHFTDYPWMHFDLAGVAYNHRPLNYRGVNGTGTGVRLVYDFIKSLKK